MTAAEVPPQHTGRREDADLESLRTRVLELEAELVTVQADNDRLRVEAGDLTDSLTSCRARVDEQQTEASEHALHCTTRPPRPRVVRRPATTHQLPREGDS